MDKLKGKRIALFMLPLLTQGGGAEKYFINLAKNISAKGYQADIVTMDENFFRKFARLLYIYALGNFFGKIDTWGREKEEEIKRRLGQARWLKVRFRDLGKILSNYDIIYAKNELVDLFLLKLAGHKKLPPIIVGMHTAVSYPQVESFQEKIHNFLYSGFVYRWLLCGIRQVHVTNESAREFVKRELKRESNLIYYPISAEETREMAEKNLSDMRFDSNKTNIIFLGRLSKQKGTDILISIISRIANDEKIKELICLNIFGSGGQKIQASIQNLEKKYSFVKYFGHIENKFIPNIIRRHDLLITTSRWETMGYNVLESQALGVPVVAFDIPGPSDIIVNGKTGFLVHSEDEFFARMKDIIERKVDFQKEAIVQNIREKFDPEKIYTDMEKMLLENF